MSQKNIHHVSIVDVRALWGSVGALMVCLLFSGVAAAQGGISQGYQTSATNLSQGELVSLVSSGSSQVQAATLSNASNLVGVAADKPVLELSGNGKSDVQVVVGGTSYVLVSDANGAVNAGDKITVSPLGGIGMKALGSSEIIGTAQRSLKNTKTVTEQAKGKDGKQITVHVGLVPVAVNVVYYSSAPSAGNVSAFVPPFFQNLANAVAGKAVSPLRVLLGAITLLLGFIAVMVMLYVAVRSGVISLGRNPLAANALRRGMFDIFLAALGVLMITGVIVAAVVLV